MTDRCHSYLDRGAALPSSEVSFPSDLLRSGVSDPALARAYRAARACRPILIRGEAGTGKQHCAKWLHQQSPRADRPLIVIRCAALTPALARWQLWGHEAGVHCAARGRSLGLLRAADGGVVLLEEIGRLPREVQGELATALMRRELRPVGSPVAVPFDIVPLATSSEDLQAEVAAGQFNRSLYDLLSEVECPIPSLRECRDAIPRLVDVLSQRHAARYERPVNRPDAETLTKLQRYHWPGNLRELSDVIERSYALDCAIAVPG